MEIKQTGEAAGQTRGEQQRGEAAGPPLPPGGGSPFRPPCWRAGGAAAHGRSGPRGGIAVCVPSAEAMAAVAGGGTGPGTATATGGARAATTNILAQLRHGQLSGRGLTRGAQVTRCGAARGTWAGRENRGGPRGLGGAQRGLGPGVQRLPPGLLAELRGRGEPGRPSGACSGRTAAPSAAELPGGARALPRCWSVSRCLPGLSRAPGAPRSSTGFCPAVLRLFGVCGLPCKERKLCLGL